MNVRQVVSHGPLQNGVGGVSSGSEAGAASPARPGAPKPTKMAKINMGMSSMSKEDQALMAKKLQTFSKDGSANYNSFSPRAKNKTKKYAEPSEPESESEDEDNKKKSKFFKHTEKERDNERRKRRDERKKRHDDDEDFAPDADELAAASNDRKRKHDGGQDDSNWLKRRRREPSPAAQNTEEFVPVKVSRKIERKLGPRIQKIDPETLMESSNFQRFNRTLETIFDNCEEVRKR